MMADGVCNLHTGYQGHGKTLMTLAHVEALRKSSSRQVFYSGIRECKLEGWNEFGGTSKDPEKPWWTDPSDWYTMPYGAIIVIDEAQRLFRPRGNGSAVPRYEQELETLRHNGHTLFLITQHPTLLSSGARKLCAVHRHFMRKFGSSWVTCHEWAGVKDNCDKSRKDSISSEHRYPKEFYDKYVSAEKHTVKFGLPLKLKLAIAFFVFLIGLTVWFVTQRLGRPIGALAPAGGAVQAQGSSGPGFGLGGSAVPGRYVAPRTPEAMYASFKPRIEGMPHTAPRYDELTAPVRAPVIVGCWLQGEEHGFCITQQGNRVRMPRAFMVSFIKDGGAFVDFDAGPPVGVESTKEHTSTKKQRGPQSAE